MSFEKIRARVAIRVFSAPKLKFLDVVVRPAPWPTLTDGLSRPLFHFFGHTVFQTRLAGWGPDLWLGQRSEIATGKKRKKSHFWKMSRNVLWGRKGSPGGPTKLLLHEDKALGCRNRSGRVQTINYFWHTLYCDVFAFNFNIPIITGRHTNLFVYD